MALQEIGAYGEYSLFEDEGRYYAASRKIDKTEVAEIVASRKAIEAASEIELIRILKESEKWADTRGLYGLEKGDPEKKVHIKVNSFNMESEAEFVIEDPCLFKNSDGLFLVEKGELPVRNSVSEVVTESDLKGCVFVGSVSTGAHPELLFEYKQHNIVEYDGVYYGIPQSLGAVELETSNPKLIEGVKYSGLLKTTMVNIDKSWVGGRDSPEEMSGEGYPVSDSAPKLLREYKGFNIVEYRGLCYGIPHALGPVQLEDIDPRELEEVVCGSQLSDTMHAIDKSFGGIADVSPKQFRTTKEEKSPYGEFSEEYRGYNIFLYEKTYIGYPADHSRINFSDTDYFSMKDVIYDVSIFAVKELINDELAGK